MSMLFLEGFTMCWVLIYFCIILDIKVFQIFCNWFFASTGSLIKLSFPSACLFTYTHKYIFY